jgi:hypothetical protein
MTDAKPKETRIITLDTAPKGKLKAVGGAVRDEWNVRLLTLVASALPVNQAAGNTVADEAATAALSGMVDMKPADPVEGVLIGQLIVASEAALSMYRRAWQQPPEYLEARAKYLSLADRATRTVALLTERLDQHRGRGQQQITVKHVTVNADQAMVAEQIVGGKLEPLSAAKLVTATADQPMEFIEARSTEAVPVEAGRIKAEMSDNPMHKAHEAPRCRAKAKRTGRPCRAPAVQGYRCRMHGARGGAPAGNRNGNYRHGARTRETIETARLIKTIRRRVQ